MAKSPGHADARMRGHGVGVLAKSRALGKSLDGLRASRHRAYATEKSHRPRLPRSRSPFIPACPPSAVPQTPARRSLPNIPPEPLSRSWRPRGPVPAPAPPSAPESGFRKHAPVNVSKHGPGIPVHGLANTTLRLHPNRQAHRFRSTTHAPLRHKESFHAHTSKKGDNATLSPSPVIRLSPKPRANAACPCHVFSCLKQPLTRQNLRAVIYPKK